VIRCRAVTLDCWGTLLLDGPGSDERYRRRRLAGIAAVLDRAGVRAEAAALERAYDEMARRLGALWREHRDVPVSEHARILLAALDPDLPGRLGGSARDDLERAYAEPALLAPPALDPGARGALEALAGDGLRLGVVSNVMRTPGSVLRQVFDRAGVLAPFAALTFSDECGVRKPAAAIFHVTLDRLGVGPDEAVHVGDDPVLDVEGALDAGLRAVLVSADRRAMSPVRPHAVIASLEELPMALGRLTDRG
jgi:putative hydrolase of the HAD superfamily